jgi:DNA-binding transcriptional LysR family regulator
MANCGAILANIGVVGCDTPALVPGASCNGRHMKALKKTGNENCRENIKRESVQIRMIDLNLFRVFDAMMQHRNVQVASRKLAVTPSAVSHALRRLRQSLRDELFVSTESSMQPTRRALEIAPAIREGLEKLELALAGKEPKRAGALRTFRIVATDYACMVILPRLVKRLNGTAQHVGLQVSACNQLDLGQHLQRGRSDLIIGSFNKLQTGLHRSKLLSDDEVIAVRKAHPLTLGEVTKERLLEFPHLLVEPTGSEESRHIGPRVEEGLLHPPPARSASREFPEETINLAGRPAVRVPHFASVVPLLQATDMVAVLPRRFARLAAANASIALLDLPYQSTKLKIEVVWHHRADHDQGLQWLLNEVVESIGDVE